MRTMKPVVVVGGVVSLVCLVQFTARLQDLYPQPPHYGMQDLSDSSIFRPRSDHQRESDFGDMSLFGRQPDQARSEEQSDTQDESVPSDTQVKQQRKKTKNTKVMEHSKKTRTKNIYDMKVPVLSPYSSKKNHIIVPGTTLPVLQPTHGQLLADVDLSRFKGETRTFMEERRRVLVKRAIRVGEGCKDYLKNLSTQTFTLTYVWDTKPDPPVLFCPNYKVASTSWMINFLRMSDFNKDNPELQHLPEEKREELRLLPKYGAKQYQVYRMYPPPRGAAQAQHLYRTALKVMVVRHPFTRILSAYRDKMLKMDPKPVEHKFRQLQLQIIREYRPKHSNETSPFPTFPEFVQYVIDSTEGYKTASDWKKVHCWTPFWAHCAVCEADYSLIVKMETMQEDERFFFNLADYKILIKNKQHEWRHLSNTSSYQEAAHYFTQIPRANLNLLRDRYKLDFDLFGYTIDDIFNYR